jgi:type II secretory pathway pseudopilin PulG
VTASGRARGFSLVEVLVALGLLAGVLLSIAGLLLLGSRQLSAGRSSSEALAVARDIIERVRAAGYRQSYDGFGCAGDEATCFLESPTDAVLAPWSERVRSQLGETGKAAVVFEGFDRDGSEIALAESHLLRVTVSVAWTEGSRVRSVELVMARM